MDCEYCGQEKEDVIHALHDCVVQKEFGIIWFQICSSNPFFLLISVTSYASTWARLVSIRLWMNGPAYLVLLFRKFGSGATNLSSHTMPLAALRWSRKLDRGFMMSILQEQVLMLFEPVKSSKKLAGKLPRNPFSN